MQRKMDKTINDKEEIKEEKDELFQSWYSSF